MATATWKGLTGMAMPTSNPSRTSRHTAARQTLPAPVAGQPYTPGGRRRQSSTHRSEVGPKPPPSLDPAPPQGRFESLVPICAGY
eukprot:294589-Pyramimonas_sp.AAC.1